ncbi:molybdopterin-dependent oxidoreductase [Granulosicoccus sp. 3-233]|uniref:molybdopterin-dependent oxidoreductase n=1 Tax=Granulosicoccus sp. 3-233 TaxID=3417969 RepID=UPI003D3265C4
MKPITGRLTASHWGAGIVTVENGRVRSVESHPEDPKGSRINDNIAGSLNGRARVLRPAVRQGWLENGPGDTTVERGRDRFVEVGWDQALDLIASELTRVRREHGNEAIFAGSYGWSSAGRFHHAQSQLKRFLNTQGGFVRSEGNYSYNAALVMMPYIVGPYRQHVAQSTRWTVIAAHSRLVVLFGGLAERNTQVSDGGVSRHRAAENLIACARAGVRFVNLSPLRTDCMQELDAQWLPPRPGSDTAIMLGLAHTLYSEGLHDADFIERYTVGFGKFLRYLNGDDDGEVKSAEWAARISGLEAVQIRELAREMASKRTMISTAAGVQRTDHGEQVLWMTVTLAAMLGQIGLPGGGYTIGYGVNANIGNTERLFRWSTLPQGRNPVDAFIPVAMISEMLLKPGEQYPYDGQLRTFPNIKMVWWAGGNPFHHHQDLNRLHRAFQQPETVIVNEFNWTATARHADIVLPVAAAQERCDFGAGKSDDALIPMPAHADPAGQARIEYDIYCDLAERLDSLTAFSEGRDADQWLRLLWEQTRDTAQKARVSLPDWDTFIAGDMLRIPDPSPDQVFLADYRADPELNPLPTPSGKIELYSDAIEGFALSDCRGHASWFETRDQQRSGHERFPLFLLSGQPATRLHSQLDNGAYSKQHKIRQREPVLVHPLDAASRQLQDGDVVELYNDRGRCLAGVRVTDEVRQGCIFLWTGAWHDPDYDAPDSRDRHGNPNVLTHDERTSSLAQGPAAHSTQVQMRRFDETLPVVTVHEPPIFSSLT